MSYLTQTRALALGVATVAALGASAANAEQNPSIGTWKLNVAESIAPQGTTFQPYTVIVRSDAPNLDYTYYNTNEKGEKVEFSYKGPADGKVRDIPGIPGMTGSMTRLPSGIVDAKLWSADGTYENKFCIMGVTLRKQTCMATVTSPHGHVVFFKQVIDKQD